MAQTVTTQQQHCQSSSDSSPGHIQFHQVGYQKISQSSSNMTVMKSVGADQLPQHATSASHFHYTMPIILISRNVYHQPWWKRMVLGFSDYVLFLVMLNETLESNYRGTYITLHKLYCFTVHIGNIWILFLVLPSR